MPSQTAESNECPICRRTFKRHEHLIRHLRTHTQERPFACPLCEKKFTRQDTLKRHLLGHADEASSSDRKENNTGLTEFDQFLDIESDPMNLNLVKTANLDWFDELTTTIQPASSEFHSTIRHIRDAPGQLEGDAAIRPVSELDSATVSQSGSTAVIGCRESNSQYLLRESLGSTSSDKPIELKLPPELFNSMVDDYARKWLRELCNK